MKNKLLMYPIVFFIMIVLFFLGMVIVHCIPATLISDNVILSLEQLNSEGGWPQILFFNNAAILDNGTDILMVKSNLEYSGNALYLAMDNVGYSRYWHGYQIYLRPLLMFFSYAEIRYLSVMVFFILLFFCFIRLRHLLGIKTALTFLISILSVNIIIIPISLQYVSCFNIAFSLILLLSINSVSNSTYAPLVFMCIGMVTNFIDFLTVPIITLGLPLIVFLLINFKKGEESWKRNFTIIIKLSVAWLLGYGLCWVSKWTLSSLFTGKNVFKDAMNTIVFRTMGNEEYPVVSRFEIIKLNMTRFKVQSKSLIWFLLIVVLTLIVLACIYRVNKQKYLNASLFVIIAAFPYVWYLILANHSQIHTWFTYRGQIVAVFAGLSAFVNIINWSSIKITINKIKNKVNNLHEKISNKKQ